MRRLLRAIRVGTFVLLAAAVAYFAAIRAQWVRPDPDRLGVLVALLCVGLLVELARAVVDVMRRRTGGVGFSGRTALALGGLGIFGGGLANWAYSLQGMIVMAEGDAAPFFQGVHLQEFVSGPLSDVKEMDVTLHLDEIELAPDPAVGVRPVASLRLETGPGAAHRFTLTPGRAASVGSLRFHLGQFGYAPHIIIREGHATLFDQEVPFRTRRDDRSRVVFSEEFTVAKYGLYVRAEVALDNLGAGLRGHPALSISVERDGRLLGTGALKMGAFAEIEAGHQVGFVGLGQWAEIDLARRPYPEPMFAGAGLALAGLLVLAGAAAVRRSRRR
jgi:hypothetical protein